MAQPEIEGSLLETLKQSDLSGVAGDAFEIALDQIVSDGLFQDIPVVSVLTRLVKTGITVRDYFFGKKLLKFLSAMSDVSADERTRLIEKLEADTNYQRKVGERIIILLERLDDLQKPELVARSFKAYLRGDIDGIELQRFHYAIDRLLMCDLSKLREFSMIEPSEMYDLVVGQNFVNAGLAYVGTGWGAGGIAPNDVCKAFVKYLL